MRAISSVSRSILDRAVNAVVAAARPTARRSDFRRSKWIESLECRQLLTTYTVQAGSDGGTSELLSAVTSACNNPGVNTINFSAALGGQTIGFSTENDEFAGPAALGIYGGSSLNLTINGSTSNGIVTIARAAGAPAMRLFNIYSNNSGQSYPAVTLENLTLTGGDAVGFNGTGNGGGAAGMGGAIFTESNLTLTDVTISGSTAHGGEGGSQDMNTSEPANAGGGGGGGLGSPGTFYDGGGPNNGVSATFQTADDGTGGGLGGGGGGGGETAGNGFGGAGGTGGFGGGAGGPGNGSTAPNGSNGGFGGGGSGGSFREYSSDGGSSIFGGSQGERLNSTTYGGAGAGMGGAIFNYLGTLTLNATALIGNTVEGGSGFLGSDYMLPATAEPASMGAGIFLYGGNVVLNNSTIANNSAIPAPNQTGNTIWGIGAGGGVFDFNGNLTLDQTTVSGNNINPTESNEDNPSGSPLDGLAEGSAIFVEGELGGNATLSLRNSILAGDYNTLASNVSGGTVAITATDSLAINPSNSYPGLTNVSASNLKLSGLGNYGGPTQSFALLPGSVALDAGAPSDLPTDQRGITRSQSSPSDVGSFESQGFVITQTGGTPQSAEVGYAFTTPLSISVAANDPGLTNLTGGTITFTAPSTSGASAFLSSTSATLASGNTAQVTAAADSTAGSYSVTATAGGPTTAATFSLTNTPFTGLVVNSTSDAANPGAGLTSLRGAVAVASRLTFAVTITFASALAGETIALSTTGDETFGPSALLVTSNVILDGGSNSITIADNASDPMRLFYIVSGGSLTLKNLTISGGTARGGGSGLGGGAAGLGGAIVNAGTLTIVQSALLNNSANGGTPGGSTSSIGGGGLGSSADSNADGGGPNGGLSSGGLNGGFGGGGAESSGGVGSGGFGGGGASGYFGGNGANGGFGAAGGTGNAGGSDRGGKIPASNPGNPGYDGGSSTDNSSGGGAGLGGAIFNYGGTVSIVNSTFANNSAVAGTRATAAGAAVFNLNGSVTAQFSTFDDNIVNGGTSGGAIASLGDNGIATQSGPALVATSPSNPASVDLIDTIVAGTSNGSGTLLPDFYQAEYNSGDGGGVGYVNSSGNNDILQTRAAGNNDFTGIAVTADPVLGTLANYGGSTETIPPGFGSPAIASAAAISGITTDQRGLPRSLTAPTIGAYEPQNSLVVTTTLDQTSGTTTSLRQAINYANTLNSPATITFASSLFSSGPARILLLGTELEITGDETIVGPGANMLSVSGNNASRVFNVSSGAFLAISGLTIAQGNASAGGGLYNNGANLSINSVQFLENQASDFGGGLASPSGGTLSITDSTFYENTAGNEAGAIEQQGVSGHNAVLHLFNCTIYNNTANGNGLGSISNVATGGNATLSVIYCTIDDNVGSATYGGGIINAVNSGSATASYIDTIFRNSGANVYNLGGTIESGGYNISSDGTGNLTAAGDQPNTNAQLNPLELNNAGVETQSPESNSPAINAGTPITGLSFDERGVNRPSDHPTIGAYQPLVAQIFSTVDDATTGNPLNGPETYGSEVYDTASLTVNGVAPTGTVMYYLYNTSSPVYGTTHAIGQQNVNLSGGLVPNSASSTVLPSGSYAYIPVYLGDGNYQGTTIGPVEPFTVSTLNLQLTGPANYLRLDPNGQSVDIWASTSPAGNPTQILLLADITSISYSIYGDDFLGVDFSRGNPLGTLGLYYSGGAGSELEMVGTTGNDSLVVDGSTAALTDSAGTGTVTYNGLSEILFNGTTGGSDTLTQSAQPGNAASLAFYDPNYNDSLIVNGGIFSFPASHAGSGIQFINLGTLSIGSGATVVVPAPDIHSDRYRMDFDNLSFAGSTGAWMGQLDLTGNDLIVHNGNLAQINSQIASGYNGGYWNGQGVVSSTAAGDTTHLTAVGAELNNNGSGQPLYGSATTLGLFDGLTPAVTDVLVKYTYYGDTDLNGGVDGSDYTRIDNGFLNHLTGWSNGDLNYDGIINGSDYTLIDNAYNMQGAALAAQIAPAMPSNNANTRAARTPSLFSQLPIGSQLASAQFLSEVSTGSIASELFPVPGEVLRSGSPKRIALEIFDS
jgi:hypothetical protein